MKELKYQFEYFCSPIWILEDNLENPIFINISVDDLQVSTFLKNEIKDLDRIYQSTYNDEYPPEPYELKGETNVLFVTRMVESALLLKKETNGIFNLIFDSSYWNSKI